MGKFVTRKIGLALALALVLAGLVVGLVWREARRQADSAARAARARELLAVLDSFSADLAEAESCRCAYVIRAEPSQRDLFRAAADQARRKLRQLADLAAPEADLRARCREVCDLAARKLALLDHSLGLRQRQRFAERTQLALSREIHLLGEALREPLAALRLEGDGVLARQAQQAAQWARQTGATVGAGNLLTLLVLAGAALTLTRDLVARERSELAARQAARRAEAHAAEQASRLSQTQAALAELGELRGRLEEQFRQAQRLASVGRVTSEVVHDFNNLLQVMLGCSEATLQGLAPDDPARAFIADVVQAGHRAAALTRQLLAVSRGRAPCGPADLNLAVADLEPILRRLPGRDVEMTVRLAPGLGPVTVDRGGLEQVLLNLVANARDAMPRGGSLTIETLPAGPGEAVLAVSDTGCGIDAQTKARLFEPFFTTKGDGKGTGLGLAIVHDAVRRCGGRVEVDSEPGRGATFRVFFPLADAAPGDDKAPGSPTAG